MTSKHAASSVTFARYIRVDDNVSVLAFQYPVDNFDFIRTLWKKPTAKSGDWYVKIRLGTKNPTTKLVSNEDFVRLYRLPSSRR